MLHVDKVAGSIPAPSARFVYIVNSSYLCINIVSQTMSRNLTPRMSSAELRPLYESSGIVFYRDGRDLEAD